MEKTFVLELRDQAKLEPDPALRMMLRGAADAIDAAVEALHRLPSREGMTLLNGRWARAERYLMQSQDGLEPGGGKGGAMAEGARLAA